MDDKNKWVPIKYHMTRDKRCVLFVQHTESRVIRKRNYELFELFDLAIYHENPKYIEFNDRIRSPQIGDIVANIGGEHIRFGEVIRHDENGYFVEGRRDQKPSYWTGLKIIHHQITGMGLSDSDHFVRDSTLAIKTLEEFNAACEFYFEKTQNRLFSKPSPDRISVDWIQIIHRDVFGPIIMWGGEIRNIEMWVGRNNTLLLTASQVRARFAAFPKLYQKTVNIIGREKTFSKTSVSRWKWSSRTFVDASGGQ